MFKLYSLFIILALSFVGCGSPSTPQKNPNEKPVWILNPNSNGKLGAVGVCGRTYDQRVSTQRKLAITRALDELTFQQGVKVNLSMQKSESLVNNRASLDMKTKGSYTANSNVTAHIEAIWVDKLSNELYVWMVLDK